MYSPYWDNNTSGSIFGLSFHVTKGHIIRACLEGVAFRTKDVIDKVGNISELKVDGGMSKNDFLMEF